MNGWMALWAAPAALGFAMLFNVPPRSLPAICGLAVVAFATRLTLLHYGVDIVMATLVAAVLIGFVAQWWARKFELAPPVYGVSAAIPMVPGTLMYQAVQALLQLAGNNDVLNGETQLIVAGVNTARAGMIVVALAIGIALPALAWRRD
ncbi:threonine/serine exporter family protein [Chitinibacteraceae bacterium HSL-7]